MYITSFVFIMRCEKLVGVLSGGAWSNPAYLRLLWLKLALTETTLCFKCIVSIPVPHPFFELTVPSTSSFMLH